MVLRASTFIDRSYILKPCGDVRRASVLVMVEAETTERGKLPDRREITGPAKTDMSGCSSSDVQCWVGIIPLWSAQYFIWAVTISSVHPP
jgi:hypothetical protein